MSERSAETPREAGGWKRLLRFSISLLVGAGFLALVFYDIDFGEFWKAVRGIHPGWYALSTLSYVFLHAGRAFRWGQIVNRVEPVPFRDLLSITSVGFLAIQALPFRLGEFARPYLLLERRDVPFGSGMYTIVVERTLDILALAAMFTVAVLFADLPLDHFVVGDWEVRFVEEGRTAITIALVPFAGCLVAFVVLQDRAVRWTEAIVGWVHRGLARRLAGLMQSFLDGVRTMRDPRLALALLGSTAGLWAANVTSMWLMCRAFGFELGPVAALVVLVMLVVGVMLPAPPAFAGVFEAFTIGALALYGIDKEPAAAYAVVLHVTQVVLIVGAGLAFLWIDQISLRRVVAAARSAGEDPGSLDGEGP